MDDYIDVAPEIPADPAATVVALQVPTQRGAASLVPVTERGVQFLFSDAVVDAMVKAGFDPVLGARPLLRAVEQLVVAALARHVLERAPQPGDVLVVDVDAHGAIVVA